MSREIGDHLFRRMFPDAATVPPDAHLSDQQDFRAVEQPPPGATIDPAEPSRDLYEYKTVRVPGAKASRRRHERALNDLAAEGWEVTDVQPRGMLQFGSKDTVTLRRQR